MGISKSELFNQYYLDEFFAVLEEYNEMHTYKPEGKRDELPEEVDAEDWGGL
jgi:hypothetical protein